MVRQAIGFLCAGALACAFISPLQAQVYTPGVRLVQFGPTTPAPRPTPARPQVLLVRPGATTVMERAIGGFPLSPDERAWLRRYMTENLVYPVLVSSRLAAEYNSAVIYLRRNQNVQALDRLQAGIDYAVNPASEEVWVTRLNMASIYRFRLNDPAAASKEYLMVRGTWRAFAEREATECFSESGRVDEAIGILQKQYQAAAEPGHKLGLLKRMSEVYARNRMEDMAIAVNDRIIKEFSTEDITRMQDVAAYFVRQQVDQILLALRDHREEDANAIAETVRRRLEQLRAEERTEEALATLSAMESEEPRIAAYWAAITAPSAPSNLVPAFPTTPPPLGQWGPPGSPGSPLP